MRIVAEMERCTRMVARVDEVAKFAARFGRHLVLPERYTRVAIIRDPGFRRSLGRQAAKQRSPLYRWNMMVFVRAPGAWSELSLNLAGKPIKRCGNIRKVNDGYDNAWFCTREHRVLWILFRLIYRFVIYSWDIILASINVCIF